MPRTALDDAVEELRKYYQLFSLEELASSDIVLGSQNVFNLTPDVKSIVSQNSDFNDGKGAMFLALSRLVVETQRGALLSPALMKQISNLDDDFPTSSRLVSSNVVIATFEPEALSRPHVGIKEILGKAYSEGINESPNNPGKDHTTLSIYQVMTSRISPSNKNSNALGIFLNAIPTIEWSRAIPYLTIKFQFQRPAVSDTGRAATPSTVKFLNGAEQLFPNGPLNGSFDLQLQTGASRDAEFELAGDGVTGGAGEAGTELFLMPQMLVNADISNGSNSRVVPVIDKFRPLASLKSFDVDVAPAAGLMAHRTAKLQFTLHDQSRLHEIADFIKPGLYNNTEMLIEYGWEHPDKSKNNVFANFINALKVKEKYAVSNYDINFKPNGEAEVGLQLYTKGAADMYTSKVGQSAELIGRQEAINALQQRISELRKTVFKQGNLTKEIRGQQILATAGDQNSSLQLSKKLRRELTRVTAGLNDNPSEDAKELRESLLKLYGKKDGTDGESREIGGIIGDEINKKIGVMKGKTVGQGGTKTPDPFLDNANDGFTKGLKKDEKFEQYVSLAKIMTLFIGQPLASLKKFDDIQFIYYTLNDHAGFARGTNLGSFPIRIADFQRRYTEVATLRRTSNLALREFMSFISNTFLEDISNPAYGLRELYKYEPDKATGKNIKVAKEFRKNPTKLNNAIEEQMKKAGVPDGTFKLPQIDMYVECVPGKPSVEGEPKSLLDGFAILRIHVFDRYSTSYQSQATFLAAQRDDSISSLGEFTSELKANDIVFEDDMSQLKDLIKKAVDRDYIQVIRPADNRGDTRAFVYKFKAGVNQIKAFIANTMPTYFHGANNTSVISSGFKTMQDQKLSTINMITTGDRGDLTPEGAATSGLPIRVFPAQADMKMMGCPIFEFSQNIFCDLKTGTSIDNIYAATKIQHSISPGKFHTSVFLTPIGDAYGQYNSLLHTVKSAITILSDFDGSDEGQT